MFRSDPQAVTHPIAVRPPLSGLLVVAAGLALLLGVAAAYSFGTATVPLLVFGAVVMLVGYGMAHRYPHPVLGLCNAVTLTRAAMVAYLAGAVLGAASPWIVFAVAVTAFALDGVDGWLARRAGLCSEFGARFDMETDAGLAAVISLWLLASGTTGPEILVLGFMRYAFVAAAVLWPALQAPLPEMFRRKAICVVQIAALIILIFPLTPAGLTWPIGVTAAILLSWSFAVDILWLARRAA
ncbi:MAG: CDP-alcohol phosphatidyltransferase family protein [Pseudomonadota bacterium]